VNKEFEKACEFADMLNEKYDGRDFEIRYHEKNWIGDEEIIEIYADEQDNSEIVIHISYPTESIKEKITSFEIRGDDFIKAFGTCEEFKKCFTVFKITKEEVPL
jgi:hypothetical protein